MSTRRVKVAVLAGFGLNCDHETAHGFQLAGARPEIIHLNELIKGKRQLAEFQLLAFIGGFSWGDDHGGGVVQAVRMKTRLGQGLQEFIADGNLVIGICNGFQTLVNLGLLPGLGDEYTQRSVALIHNDCGNFRDDWVHLHVNAQSPCVFTRGMESLDLPVRHGEGKFYTDPKTLEQLQGQGLIPLQYALPGGNPAQGKFPHNPNGSLDDVAGICDPSGRVFGLMPHPEAFHHWTNHPQWTRLKANDPEGYQQRYRELTPGIRMLKNGVDYILNQN
jgi:phosphoribosylformylglycinamidine synthase